MVNDRAVDLVFCARASQLVYKFAMKCGKARHKVAINACTIAFSDHGGSIRVSEVGDCKMTDPVFGSETQPEIQALQTVEFADAAFDAIAHEAAIEREARAARANGGAWGEYLRKVLSPTGPQSTMRLLHASRI